MSSDIVLLLPGQGSQRVGMGKDLADAFPAAREVFRAADDAADAKISALSFEGPSDELTRTLNAQPALLAHSAAVWAVIRETIAPRVRAAAGHSLGEFSACFTAGTFTFEDAIRVVRRRGVLMYEQGLAHPGAMAAIVGSLHVAIEEICTRATAEAGLVVPANFNGALQTVISGEIAGVQRAMVLAKEAGAKRCLPLPVSGAFHSPLMAPAVGGLETVLASVPMATPAFPIVANVTAEPVHDADTARALLVEQLTAPVQWTRVMERLVRDHPGALFVEIGTGHVLSGIARRIAPDVHTATCGTVEEVEALLARSLAHV